MAGTAECRPAREIISGHDHDDEGRPEDGTYPDQFPDMLLYYRIEIGTVGSLAGQVVLFEWFWTLYEKTWALARHHLFVRLAIFSQVA